ncbi:hypothetical protein CLV98_105245 [Dyadobacter jejuensis]|uniref:Uncharacterized protein n=1 Tax=Dyadobacter jejuensis TaxID=1082580 RepID=A0A316AJY0_9BACT|nr:hypothetical protein [Dyadobacter jejuensis]PWJ58063.1 hypothetical protein CLV98_105245 [Dyadobacter jejuensis]
MIGFELTVRGEKVTGALRDGVFSIILTKMANKDLDTIELDFTGLNTADTENYETLAWYQSSLAIGDEIIIKVKEIQDVSPPIKVGKHNLENRNAQRVEEYYRLKRELEEKGLI